MLRQSCRLLQPSAAAAVGQRSRVPVVGLQVLFPDSAPSGIIAEALTEQLHRFDPALNRATLRAPPVADADGLTGIASWPVAAAAPGGAAPAEHRVDVIVRHHCPLPPQVARDCIDYSLYPQPVKARMAQAQSAAYLSYRGLDAVPPLEKYVAVSAVAAALCEAAEACGVLNVNALTSAPASMFSRRFITEAAGGAAASPLDFFRALPLTTLYAGFQPYQTEDAQGAPRIGFRTHGAELLGLPNLATYAADVAAAEVVFYVFHAVWELMQKRDRPLVAGEPVQLTADPATGVAVRNPTAQEAYLQHPPQGVLVLEPAKDWAAFASLTGGTGSSSSA